jgi:hypothetical protein
MHFKNYLEGAEERPTGADEGLVLGVKEVDGAEEVEGA